MKDKPKQLHRLVSYMSGTTDLVITGQIRDKPEQLELKLFVDADFAGDRDDAKSSSGGLLILSGPNTWFPLSWVSKKQTAVSRSTTEAELISMAHSVFSEAMPMLTLWEWLLKRPVALTIMEDNEATIKVINKGYSAKLRHIMRTHKVNIASLHEVVNTEKCRIEYVCSAEQAADIFTKSLDPCKWDNALNLLHMRRLAA